MTGREKIEAEEKKQMMYYAQDCACYFCGKQLHYSQAEFAHRVPKGYAKKYGKAIIHHQLNGRITCHDCNCKALLDPKTHPIEAAELIERIEKVLKGKL